MNYNEYVNPGLGLYLKKLRLDKEYLRGNGSYLYYKDEQGQEVEVKDFIGGYGSLALGHHCKELVDYAKDLLDTGVPIHSQMSSKYHTGQLGKFISDEIGRTTNRSYITTFTNSGAETVEAAIKHARLKKLDELKMLTNQVHRILNVICNLCVKGTTPLLKFKGKEYRIFNLYKEDILKANEKVIQHMTLKLLVSEKSYHGKTLCALKATHNDKYKAPFILPSEGKEMIFFPWDESFIEMAIASCRVKLFVPELNGSSVVSIRETDFNTCIAMMIEPILGEGGVIVAPPSFLKKLKSLSVSFKVPLILDEIQTGVYRTGPFLCSFYSGITADYYLLGKSLGGGLVKIGAMVTDKAIYSPEFGLLHNSTFAEDDFSSAISLKALELLKKESHKVEEISDSIFKKLQAVKALYPHIIAETHGKGLMIAVTFRPFHNSACYPLQFVSRSNYFNYFIASYLLNNCNIRIAPTLSSSFTIRIQPSINITEEDINVLVAGINNVCEVLHAEDFYKLIEKLLPENFHGLRHLREFSNGEISISKPGARKKVGFVNHFINEENVIISDPSLAVLPVQVIEGLLGNIMEIGTAVLAGTKVIRDDKGMEVEMVFVGLPFTSGMARNALIKNETGLYLKSCNNAIEMLIKEYQVEIIGLGQYTSIITNNGTAIPHSNVYITTGNSFTTFIGLQSVLHEIKKETIIKKGDDIVIGILGAAGNISSVYAKCCSQFVSTIYLKGSDRRGGVERIERSARELLKYLIKKLLQQKNVATSSIERTIKITNLYQQVSDGQVSLDDVNLYALLQEELAENNPIITFSDMEMLKKCNLVIVATNVPVPFLTEEHFNSDTIVYDISVPLNVTEELFNNSKNIKIIVGGVVTLPNREVLPIKGYPLEEGTAYACMSETMLLGLEEFQGNFSFGNITPELVYKIGGIANKHGFYFLREKVESIF